MHADADLLKKLATLLLSPELDAVRLGLKILDAQNLQAPIPIMLAWIWYQHDEPVREEIEHLLQKDMDQVGLNKLLEGMSLLRVPYRKYIWYSQHTYNTSESELLTKIAFFKEIEADYTHLFSVHPQYFQAYEEVAQVIWTYYRRPEAEPLLKNIVAFNAQAKSNYFYLAQIYQEALLDDLKALAYYEKYVTLAPKELPYNDFCLNEWFIEYRNYRPSTVEALSEMGHIYLVIQEDVQKAERFYRQAINLAPNNHQAPYIDLAKLLASYYQKFSEALALYIQCSEVWAKSKAHSQAPQKLSKLYVDIARLYEQEFQDPNQALHYCKEAKKVDADNTEALLLQIELVLHYYSDYWQAKTLCQQLLSKAPQHPQAKKYLKEVKQQLNF